MNVVLIPAAGSGTRMGGDVPKQFLLLAGVPILARTLARFQESPEIAEIIVAAPAEFHERVRAIAREHGITKLTEVVAGGNTRQQSVWNALQSVPGNAKIVLVHDAVRPFVAAEDIHSVIEAAERHGAAILAARMKDTVKSADESGFVVNTLDRNYLWSVQTPQAFRRSILYDALRKAAQEEYIGTDEASAVEFNGGEVKIVEARDGNMKITTQGDLLIAEAVLAQL